MLYFGKLLKIIKTCSNLQACIYMLLNISIWNIFLPKLIYILHILHSNKGEKLAYSTTDTYLYFLVELLRCHDPKYLSKFTSHCLHTLLLLKTCFHLYRITYNCKYQTGGILNSILIVINPWPILIKMEELVWYGSISSRAN